MYLINAQIIFILSFLNAFARGNLLLLSSTDLSIPALEKIELKDLENHLRTKLKKPKLIAFRRDDVDKNLVDLFKMKYLNYLPNCDEISFENSTILSGNIEEDKKIIEDVFLHEEKDENLVVALDFLNSEKTRLKRDLSISSSPTGPVLLNATSKSKQAMIYSSKPLLFIFNNNSFYLGNPITNHLDSRDTYVRLIETFQLLKEGPEKITLRFTFPLNEISWSLSNVIVEKEAKQYNLTLEGDVSAPRRFSYHCGGETLFKNEENDVRLILYEIQAQPCDVDRNRFSDAYHCVPFVTVPILSGYFITSIFLIGLYIGLEALGNIKVMDKFDNHKTKQLNFTVVE